MNYVDVSGGCDGLFSGRREVRIIGILDSIFGATLLVILLTLSIYYVFTPDVIIWILIFSIHTLQLCIAATLITATFEMSSASHGTQKCRAWFYYSRFFFDWIFPIECFFLIMFIGGNGSQYLWIICGVVNVAFRYFAEQSVLSYIAVLKGFLQQRYSTVDLSDFDNTDVA